MNKISLLYVILVPVLNIAFNTFASLAAKTHENYLNIFLSLHFLAAFLIGCTSLVALTFLYKSGIELGRGILIMGIISVVIGSIWGFLYKNEKPTVIEIILLLLMTTLLIYRYYQATNKMN